MHISEPPQATAVPAKCSKMNEHSNGAGEAAPKEEQPTPRASALHQGGRLKFFKDGKFILELERAREGERMSWVSVPRKTFWPPQGTAASTPTYRQEGSTSLSVSDDNSSIQSSPWQRDHSWKQTTPKRNLSKRLGFFFKRIKTKERKAGNAIIKLGRKRRRPYSASPEPVLTISDQTKLSIKSKKRTLSHVVQLLVEKGVPVVNANSNTNANANVTPPRAEVVVSPRKRILREMEKDGRLAVEELIGGTQSQKRSRGKTASISSAGLCPISPIVNKSNNNNNSINNNGVIVVSTSSSTNSVEVEVNKAPLGRNNSYSITSLLAEDRNVIKRSPDSSPSHFTAATNTQQQQQYCSPPPPEDRWYSESVDKLRSIELSQAEKRAFSAYPSYPYMPHYMYPYSIPSYYYSRGYMQQAPIYPAPHLHPLPVRPEVPTCSWTSDAVRDVSEHHREDNIPDMPLNLSKHAG